MGGLSQPVFQAALAWKLDHTLCPTSQGNSLWRRMGLTLALRGLFTPLKGMGVNCPLSGPPGLRYSLGGEAASTGEQFSCTVLYCTAELVPSSTVLYTV
jgi:hypothetical protein